MNFKDLRYIVAIRNHRHFSKAADECCVSQPTLSMQLKKLEETLGVKLFERSNKEVHITAAGEKIAEKAREALQKEEDIKRIAQHFQNPYAGEFIFGAFPTLAPFLFPKIAPKISKKFPDMTLFLKEEVSERLVHSVRNGKIDFALSAQPVEDKKIQQHNLFLSLFMLPSAHLIRSARKKKYLLSASRTRNCCCSKTNTVYQHKPWRHVYGMKLLIMLVFGPPVLKRCARWWWLI